jgi:hypothetical protein
LRAIAFSISLSAPGRPAYRRASHGRTSAYAGTGVRSAVGDKKGIVSTVTRTYRSTGAVARGHRISGRRASSSTCRSPNRHVRRRPDTRVLQGFVNHAW